MPTHRRHRELLPSIVAASFALAACGSGGGPSAATSDDARIVVTTNIWGDIVEQVVGDCATVEVLIPRGADPHGFEPSARQAAALREADLVIANGLGLEEQLSSTLETAEDDGVEVVSIGERLEPLPFAEEQGDASGNENDAGELDPHIWQDPERIARAVLLLADDLAGKTDCDDATITDQADAYAEEIRAVDRQIGDLLAEIPTDERKLVTNHDAFGYFADRYGFEIVGTVIPSGSTLAEPSSAELAELAQVLEDEGVDAIFAENTQPARLAEALADETGHPIDVVELFSDSLGESGSGAETYLDLMRTNAERIRDALSV